MCTCTLDVDITRARARAEVLRRGVSNLRFEVKDAAAMEEAGAFDLVTTFDAVHDQARPDVVLRAIHRALRKDGVYLMQDIGGSRDLEKNTSHPMAPFLYTVSCLHCMTVSLAQGGAGLGAMWGIETAEAMLAEAGFSRFEMHRLPHDEQNVDFVLRK